MATFPLSRFFFGCKYFQELIPPIIPPSGWHLWQKINTPRGCYLGGGLCMAGMFSSFFCSDYNYVFCSNISAVPVAFFRLHIAELRSVIRPVSHVKLPRGMGVDLVRPMPLPSAIAEARGCPPTPRPPRRRPCPPSTPRCRRSSSPSTSASATASCWCPRPRRLLGGPRWPPPARATRRSDPSAHERGRCTSRNPYYVSLHKKNSISW